MTLLCHDGQARALFELSLGRTPGPSGVGGPRPRMRPPSYKRRQEARKAARQARAADQASPNDTTKATDEVVTTAAKAEGTKDAGSVARRRLLA